MEAKKVGRLPVYILPAAVLLSLAAPARLSAGEKAKGVVFLDDNGNGRRDDGERGLEGIGVSNGADVTLTNEKGRYSLPVGKDSMIFVIKPRNYMTPVDELHIARFYYNHKPRGSPRHLKYPGVSPTGPLPKSIDFPLVEHPEPDEFTMICFGDPQPRNVQEVNYLAFDLVQELIGSRAAFGVSLGDIAFDNLDTYGPYNQVMSAIGIPWYNIHGNHDMNYDVKTDVLADETWERVFGPPTYSFNWGPVHFIVLDSVHYDGDVQRGKYHAEIGRHLKFIKNDLKHVPREKLVVVMMHIPIIDTVDARRLFAILETRPFSFSLSAHWHFQQHLFLGPKQGWRGERAHHHLVHATACGAWWAGALDEFGIPHATQRDGAPNGYSFISFKDNRYAIRFKAARRPPREQMSIYVPDQVRAVDVKSTEVVVNVYAGSQRSLAEMKVGDGKKWRKMKLDVRPDPWLKKISIAEKGKAAPNGRKMPALISSPHIWVAKLPARLAKGTHTIHVRTRDMFGGEYYARRVIRVY